ncbi:hypothetical protein GQ600_16511 [Phytophthora cactorum]|nr:hypothetical protein GQ600_16511 [Phytophthora cactorum]
MLAAEVFRLADLKVFVEYHSPSVVSCNVLAATVQDAGLQQQTRNHQDLENPEDFKKANSVATGMIFFNVSSTNYRHDLFSIVQFQRQARQQITISFQLRKVSTSNITASSVVHIPVNVAVSFVLGMFYYLRRFRCTITLIVMRGVRSIARTGRTVLLFDRRLLLKKGGCTPYFDDLGVDSVKMLEYLASIPGTMEIRPQYNTTTFMLEVVGAGIGCDVKDYSVEYKNSELCRLNRERTLELAEHIVAKINSHIGFIYNNMDFIGVVNLMTVLEVTLSLWFTDYLIIVIILFVTIEY